MRKFLKLLILPILSLNFSVKPLENNELEKRPQIKGITFENRQFFEFVESPKLQKLNGFPRQETNSNLC